MNRGLEIACGFSGVVIHTGEQLGQGCRTCNEFGPQPEGPLGTVAPIFSLTLYQREWRPLCTCWTLLGKQETCNTRAPAAMV